jgi:PAS domain S-box-containing protein
MGDVPDDSVIVLDTVTEAYIRLDSDFRCTFVNRAALPILGKLPAELLGNKLGEAFPSSTGTPLELVCRRAMAERIVVTAQHCFEPSQPWQLVTVIPDSQGGICVKISDISQHTLMEDTLQKSEDMFSKAFRYSPAPMCIVDIDRDRCFLDVNEAFERITGYRRDEIVGRTVTGLGFLGGPDVAEEARRRLLEEGRYRNLECPFIKKSGEVITCLISAERITLNGSLCSIAVAIDITDRTQVQQELQDSEELYRRLFEVEPDALALVDRESGQILAANAAASSLYGYSHEELLSMKAVDFSAELDQTVQARISMPTFVPLRWHKKKDGTTFPVEVTISYFELKGRVVFLSVITPLDGQRQRAQGFAERKIRNARWFRDELSDVLESFTEGFQAFDREFRLTYMNRAAERILDGDSAELTGKPVWGEFPANISIEVERQLREVMRHRKPESSESFDVQRCRWFLINMYPFRDGVSVLFRDISERKQWDLQREQVIKELRHAIGQVRTLHGLIPICAWCKKIRNDEGYWQQLEAYISEHTEADLSHGMCPDCATKESEEQLT